MATVTKKELIDRIADSESTKRTDVKRIVQTFLDLIVEELAKGNRLEFRDFGVFECRLRASRDAQNPKTMARVKVPPKRTVKFKAGRVMKLCLHETPPEVDEATGLTVEASAHRPAKAALAAAADGAAPRRRSV
jgi:integration host factor subunit beta